MEIRRFYGRDFEATSKIVGDTWYAEQGSHSYWFGADELCTHLMKSDYGLVALEDDEVVGVLLLGSWREGDHDSQMQAVWRQQRTNIRVMMRALDIVDNEGMALVEEEDRLVDEAAATLGTEGVATMPLLIVAPAARGHGVAKKLLREGLAWMESHGARELRLATSDDCDWNIYDRWGMRRVKTSEHPAGSGYGVYVYQGKPDLDTVHEDCDRKDKGMSDKTTFDVSSMSWTREPAQWEVTDAGLSITTEPGTDLWQRTYYHFRNDNAPALQLETDEKFFSFVVRTDFSGAHHRFDQCGVVIYLDSENWIKGSVEYEDGVIQHLGSVVTNHGWSDWATTEIPADTRQMWYRLSRREDDYRIDCSADGKAWHQMRVCHLHEGAGTIRVGVYACSPEDSSFTAHFTDLQMGPCAWQAHDGQQPDEE